MIILAIIFSINRWFMLHKVVEYGYDKLPKHKVMPLSCLYKNTQQILIDKKLELGGILHFCFKKYD